jgi:cytosine/adenosine deaminase-related metal-dependent hydrolase
MEETGWVGNDVWYAHGIYFNDEEIRRLAETKTGVAHCPASNLRLGSGICQVPKLLDAGVPVGLAVDGSASNDASNFVREMQLALLVHRVGTAVDAMPASKVLHIATRGGAEILNHENIGIIEEGKAADLAIFGLNKVEFAGAMQDPASAILFCGSGTKTDYTIVNGKIVADHGTIPGLDESSLFNRANRLTDIMVRKGWG